jgi:hypothetical protein
MRQQSAQVRRLARGGVVRWGWRVVLIRWVVTHLATEVVTGEARRGARRVPLGAKDNGRAPGRMAGRANTVVARTGAARSCTGGVVASVHRGAWPGVRGPLVRAGRVRCVVTHLTPVEISRERW